MFSAFPLTGLRVFPAACIFLEAVGQCHLPLPIEETVEPDDLRLDCVDAIPFVAELLFVVWKTVFSNLFEQKAYLHPFWLFQFLTEKRDHGGDIFLDNDLDCECRTRQECLNTYHVNLGLN